MTAIPRSLDKLHRSKVEGVRKGNLFYAYPHKVHEMEGFNPRDYSREAVQQHIRNLANAFKAGEHVEPITVRVIDGEIYVVEGHCRRRAMMLAIEEGADLGMQPLIEFKGDDTDAQKKILTSQMGEKLTKLELAEMYQRMVNRGKTLAEVGEIVGKTAEHVRQTLDIHTLPDEIKQLIHEGTVSSDLATKTYNELGSEAIAILKEGVEEQLVAGKKKLTPAALDKKRGVKPSKRMSKKVVSGMRDQLTQFGSKLEAAQTLDDGTTVVELSSEEVDNLKALLEQIAEPEEPSDAEEQGVEQLEGEGSEATV